jgi:hypothetical protein
VVWRKSLRFMGMLHLQERAYCTEWTSTSPNSAYEKTTLALYAEDPGYFRRRGEIESDG